MRTRLVSALAVCVSTLAVAAPGRQRDVPIAPLAARTDYRVRAGDTLTTIAARNGTTVDALSRLNGLHPDGILREGARLKLPAAAAVREPAPADVVRAAID